ncbi:MAG TPA: BfmA/BtgA family mobilization protein [Mucilaginibacter sp.]|jgi:hypothetical protein|nr:BfmA/BtgA family mobilization protein [Mucilaginibacter sp.]
MTQDNDNKRTVKYSVETDAKLQKLADTAGCSKRDYFMLMVEYFYRTKKDPKDINDEQLKRTLSKNHDTYIRFIRAQEEKILIPLKVEFDRMVASQIKIIDSFNSQVLKANRDILSGQQSQAMQTEKALRLITEKLDTKESLKNKFLYVLNYFYKASLNASSREKETLLQEAISHITKL